MWQIQIPKKVLKDLMALPDTVSANFWALIKVIEILGPVRGDWPNYGKLRPMIHHCHVKKGHPTYVMVWKDLDPKLKKVEVLYAGTHEKADYKKFR